MRIILAALLSSSCLVTADAWAAQPCPASSVPALRTQPLSSYSVEVGVVEDVIALEQDGYQFRAYVVSWHGSRVLVSDPLAQTMLGEGDRLHYIAIHTSLPNGQLLLDFVSTERSNTLMPRTGPPPLPSMDVSSSTASGVIEDVLSARDGGYRFISYVVRYQGQRIALMERSQGTPRIRGDEIRFVEMRTTMPQRRLVGFRILSTSPIAASSAARIDRAVSESGVVAQVLSAQSDGYLYRAYVVEWHDTELLLPDETGSTDYRVGDALPFTARHLQVPGVGRLVRFSLLPASGADPAFYLNGSPGSLATKAASATVKQILAGNVDGDTYSAYIVDWNGQQVGVTDEFATTHFVIGQQIALPVTRIDVGGSKRLQLMMFNFPKDASHTVASGCHSSE